MGKKSVSAVYIMEMVWKLNNFYNIGEKPLKKFEVNLTLPIEDAYDNLQIDFANKLIGGGVLSGVSISSKSAYKCCLSDAFTV